VPQLCGAIFLLPDFDMSFAKPSLASLAFACFCLPALAFAEGIPDPNGRLNKIQSGIDRATYQIKVAQFFGRSQPEEPPAYEQPQPGSEGPNPTVRIDRLENQLRNLNGQIEQIQFQQRKLEEQLNKMQRDIDFRFQEISPRTAVPTPSGTQHPAPQRRSDATDGLPAPETAQPAYGQPQQIAPAPPAGEAHVAAQANTPRRGDAFNPDASPNAPGAPRNLGTLNGGTSGPLADNSTPLDLSRGAANASRPLPMTPAPSYGAIPPAPAPGANTTAALEPANRAATPGGTIIADPTAAPRSEYELAIAYMKQGQYESAEKSLATFLSKSPKGKQASDATFYLGETYYHRGRHREAAEQYLKISTDFPQSPRAPEALLRLGQSLHVLGAKEQACATFSEVARKYPNASAAIRTGAERESKKANC
jgi:tol-pal system protein YbgF